jgi:ribonuclease-3
MDDKTLRQLEQLLDYRFSNPSLLAEAIAHSSQADNRLASNERLEFLGDSVLALVICRTLFTQFPDYLEGDLTKIKSRLVSRKTCAQLANRLGLTKFVQVGKGMAKTRAMSGSITAGTLEAVIAAIYLDGGLSAASDFILKMFGPLIDQADADEHQENFKSFLQQYVQRQFNMTPDYELLDEKGPDHDKCFESAVVIGERRFPGAWGMTKKDAEQKAAYSALVELGQLQPKDHG